MTVRSPETQRKITAIGRLMAIGERRRELNQQLDELREETIAAIVEGDEAGLTAYSMAKNLGMNEGHVGMLRNTALDREQTEREMEIKAMGKIIDTLDDKTLAALTD